MGKGQRSREARAGQKEELKKIAAKKKLHKKIKKIVGISLTSVIALALVFMVTFNAISSTGYFLRNTVAMKTDNYEIDNAMMTYYVKNQYYNYANTNSDVLEALGLDSQKSLASQSYGDGTWLDFFLSSAKTQANSTLLFAEKARADGIELTEDDLAGIDETINSFKTEAETYGLTMGQYYSQVFGSGIKEDDVRRAIELSTLASKYYEKFEESLTYTDEDYQKHFEENESAYVKADYISVTVPGETEAEIKNNAKIFQNAKTVEEFEKLVKDLITADETASYLESNDIASEAELSDTQRTELDEHIQSSLDAAHSTASKPDPDAEDTAAFNKWLFEDGRKVADIYTAETAADEENNVNYSIKLHMVEKTAYCDDYKLMKARHIMFTTEEYETLEAAKAKAEEVLKLYQEDATVEKFAELAKEYSEDTATSETGGLYEQITNDTTAWPFSEWVYAEGRKTGDVEIVQTDLGYHIMYFEGEGDVAWKATAKETMISEDYDAHIEELGQSYTVTQYDNKMKQINV